MQENTSGMADSTQVWLVSASTEIIMADLTKGLCRDMITRSGESEKDRLSEQEIWYNSGHSWAAATYRSRLDNLKTVTNMSTEIHNRTLC